MSDKDLFRLDRAKRVKAFGIENRADFKPGGKGATLFQELGALLLLLDEDIVGQIRTPVSKETAIDALQEDFKNIARTARSIEIDEPGFAGDFRYPEGDSEAIITTHAKHLLSLLEDQEDDSPEQKAAKAQLRDQFIAYEMEEDFVADLREDLAALTGEDFDKIIDNQEGVESTAAISKRLAEIRKIVTKLDAIMHNKYGASPEKLSAWRSASRVERAAKKPKKKAEEKPAQTA